MVCSQNLPLHMILIFGGAAWSGHDLFLSVAGRLSPVQTAPCSHVPYASRRVTVTVAVVPFRTVCTEGILHIGACVAARHADRLKHAILMAWMLRTVVADNVYAQGNGVSCGHNTGIATAHNSDRTRWPHTGIHARDVFQRLKLRTALRSHRNLLSSSWYLSLARAPHAHNVPRELGTGYTPHPWLPRLMHAARLLRHCFERCGRCSSGAVSVAIANEASTAHFVTTGVPLVPVCA